MNEPRRHYGAMMSGLDVHYDLGAGHPLLGSHAGSGAHYRQRSATGVNAVAPSSPVLLNFGDPDGLDIAPWADEARWVNATYGGAWSFGFGQVAAPTLSWFDRRLRRLVGEAPSRASRRR